MKKYNIKLYVSLIIAALFFASCADDDLTSKDILDIELDFAVRKAGGQDGLNHFVLPSSTQLSQIPQDPANPLTNEKIELGRLLYHETAMSTESKEEFGSSTYSCASCHHAAAGFQSGLRQGIGDGGIGFGLQGEGRHPDPAYNLGDIDVQPLRTPTTLNSAFQEVMLWNGQFGATGINAGTEGSWTPGTPKETNNLGYEGIETQAIAGLTVHRMLCDPPSMSGLGYKELFDQAFSDFPEDKRYTNETAGLAIAAYERTLLANEAPFQKWLRGDMTAMTKMEKKGAALFFGKANCTDCHTGPALNKMEFTAIGMADLEGADIVILNAAEAAGAARGRGGFTNRDADMYAFKVPQLYNLLDSRFYGHGASFSDIKSVLEYKNAARSENSNVPVRYLHSAFTPLELTNEEIDALTAFMTTGLYDTSLERYVPGSILSGQCFPNNDDQSRTDLGCN